MAPWSDPLSPQGATSDQRIPHPFPHAVKALAAGRCPFAPLHLHHREITRQPSHPNSVAAGGSLMASQEDVNVDGRVDLVLHFEGKALVDAGAVQPTASTQTLVLLAHQTDKRQVKGSEKVRVMP